ncbi:MAG TPA: VWA domain-containing protein [Candidatus Angelobacter sp.]|jgi:VWFA-related protein
MYRLKFIPVVALLLTSFAPAQAQNSENPSPSPQTPSISVRSNLVLVPVLVKTNAGKLVFSLGADDFILTDDGVPQPLRMEDGSLSQPLALAVVVQTGGLGASHLKDYRNLGPILDAIIGGVPHHVAVVGFDSQPRVEHDFTANTDGAALTIASLQEGDAGAAILDALSFGIDLLRQQPANYRRAVLLVSETIDSGSETSLEEAVRAVEDSNTSIYSFGFSSTRAAVAREGAKLPAPGGTPYSNQPYAPGGCMSKDPKAAPDAHGKRGVQAWDCASDLLPPLRLARMAFLAAKDGIRQNVPRSVAHLTGGEYFPFHDAKSLAAHLITISNDVPNYYVLSFRPQSPRPGPHALELRLKNKSGYEVRGRKGYWVEDETETKE